MNPWAWNMNANMIYLEAPVGVGFSKGSADDMKHISDDTTSSDNRDALKVKIRTDRTDQSVRPRLIFPKLFETDTNFRSFSQINFHST